MATKTGASRRARSGRIPTLRQSGPAQGSRVDGLEPQVPSVREVGHLSLSVRN